MKTYEGIAHKIKTGSHFEIMNHLAVIRKENDIDKAWNGKPLIARATGRFYTPDLIGKHLANAVLKALSFSGSLIEVVEPFCGDGRLICRLLEAAARRKKLKNATWRIELWDCESEALNIAKEQISEVAAAHKIKVELSSLVGDSFAIAPQKFGRFLICITNPPWEVLKPDRREMLNFTKQEAARYTELLRLQDELLNSTYPLSKPIRKFSGWGTNLARCGTELSLRLVKDRGVCGIVSPASFLADQLSERLRAWVFSEHRIHDVAYYSAEARLFDKVDQPSITIVASRSIRNGFAPGVALYNKSLEKRALKIPPVDWKAVAENGYVLPLQFGLSLIHLQAKWKDLSRFSDLEEKKDSGLWAGRELDETGHQKYLAREGKYLFIKGRMIQRFGVVEQPTQFVKAAGPKIPASADFHRIVWRDVARPNQKRRMHATIIPPGWVTGNSLSVAYFRDNDLARLKALFAVMNSFVFEAQVRAFLATGHISLGAVRQARMPALCDAKVINRLAKLVDKCLEGDRDSLIRLEVLVAKLYGLSKSEFGILLASFDKLGSGETEELLLNSEWKEKPTSKSTASQEQMDSVPDEIKIPNHYSPSLSELDQRMVECVPPGGNWKNIPDTIPSQRLKQIRESYAAGGGSRSTYYGRLRPDAPSYTISTYISRPGNGCHIHYDFEGGQHRVLSQREAARLQSFPDNFVFTGSRAAINQQIGNAVPPLLAYQIAKTLPYRGQFVDLFSGAGGLALGFSWAGWEPLVANDIEAAFLETYKANIHENAITGDIREGKIFKQLVKETKKRRNKKLPLFVLGGPPCQGFSTAGNRRSMEDHRNWLFTQYKAFIEAVKPTGFLFENVPGLLNMEDGRVFQMISKELQEVAKGLSIWKLHAEEYGIPQRRTRVILVGNRQGRTPFEAPKPITHFGNQQKLFVSLSPAITVAQALSDLPPLKPGEDGSSKEYLCEPTHPYQEFMRGLITASEYLEAIASAR